jgi:hypothetical protein
VDTKIINVYNEKNQKLVGSGLLIVDAAIEPLKVLKVLVEGLPDGRSGLWLTNFKGIPVARTLSPFDLVYLDPSYYVVHCVEISVDGAYEPFRGEPASALVLPAKSIVRSKTQAGDRFLFRTVDTPQTQPSGSTEQARPNPAAALPAAPSGTPATAHFFNSAFPIPPVESVGAPIGGFPGGGMSSVQASAAAAPSATAVSQQEMSGRHANAPASGRLAKTAKSLLGNAPAFKPSSEGDAPSGPADVGSVSAGVTYAAPPPVEMAFSVRMPTRLVATPAMPNVGPEQVQSAHPLSGRLMRSVSMAPAMLPVEEPEPPAPVPESEAAVSAPAEPAVPIEQQPAAQAGSAAADPVPAIHHQRSNVIPITAAAAIQHPVPFVAPEAAAAATALTVVEKPGRIAEAIVSPAPAQTNEVVTAPAQPAAASASASTQLAQSAALPATPPPAPYPRTQIKRAESENAALARSKKKLPWDVRLLYALFPDLDPSRPPEVRIPGLDEQRTEEEEELSTKLRFLCWLYPDLHLDQVKQKRSTVRRAVRLPMPGLVAYFFTGGAPRPHPIKDISVTGFYMCTTERWLPGTIVRVTLQMVDSNGDGGLDSITVHSRVVRWGPDGGGFEFVLPGFLES